jgi:pyruvate/2-oxoglutarate dehydrogenase complex dihydrolipoamide dehydrogenase (E3) component
MVNSLIETHIGNYEKSGAELILGEGCLTGSRTLEVKSQPGGMRRLTADRVFLNVGTHATIPDIPGLAAATRMTHVEALDLDRTPSHLIILGGGSVGLELGQAMRRLGTHGSGSRSRPHTPRLPLGTAPLSLAAANTSGTGSCTGWPTAG